MHEIGPKSMKTPKFNPLKFLISSGRIVSTSRAGSLGHVDTLKGAWLFWVTHWIDRQLQADFSSYIIAYRWLTKTETLNLYYILPMPTVILQFERTFSNAASTDGFQEINSRAS